MNNEQINDLVSQGCFLVFFVSFWFFCVCVRFGFLQALIYQWDYEYFSYCFRMASEFHLILPHNTKTVTL